MHSTNYYNTFIRIAPDSKATAGRTPLEKAGRKTIAGLQLEMIGGHPYRYCSDDVLFQVYALRNQLPETKYTAARKQFFSKGQACFRASPLPKSFGWGVHFDAEGRMAVYGCETEQYRRLEADSRITQVNAMRSSK
ncbi:DUF6157 family protein [Niabella terrae]